MFRNPLVPLMKLLIRLYRLIFSPWLGNQCRFHPTCSHYAEEAFEKHGFLKGFVLMVWRIVRCAPWGKGPWTDPVPERFEWRFAWTGLFRYKKSHSENLAEKPEQK